MILRISKICIGGHKNSWEYFWKQPTEYTLEKVKHAKNIIVGARSINNISNLYSEETICSVSSYIKMIPFSDRAVEHLDVKYMELIAKCGSTSNILGVLARGTDYTSLHPHKHAKVPTVEELFEKIEEPEYKQYYYIFLATEDETIYKCFLERYGDRLLTSGQELYHSNTKGKALSQIRKKRKHDYYYRGLEYLTTIYLLSKCDTLIASRVSGTTVAVWWNQGRYKNTYIFDLGTYE